MYSKLYYIYFTKQICTKSFCKTTTTNDSLLLKKKKFVIKKLPSQVLWYSIGTRYGTGTGTIESIKMIPGTVIDHPEILVPCKCLLLYLPLFSKIKYLLSKRKSRNIKKEKIYFGTLLFIYLIISYQNSFFSYFVTIFYKSINFVIS